MNEQKPYPCGQIGGNEVLEVWGTTQTNGLPTCIHADRQVQDQRAKIVFDLIRAWGHMASHQEVAVGMMGEFLPKGEAPPAKPLRPSREIVMTAIEMVDTAWTELQLRGWILDLPTFIEYNKFPETK